MPNDDKDNANMRNGNNNNNNYNTSNTNDQTFEKGIEKADRGYSEVESSAKSGVDTAKKIENAPERLANKTENLANKSEKIADVAEKAGDALSTAEKRKETVDKIKNKAVEKKDEIKKTVKEAPKKAKEAAQKAKNNIKNAPKKVKEGTLKGINQVKSACQKGKNAINFARNNPGEAAAKVGKKAKEIGKNAGKLAKETGKSIVQGINPVTRVKRKIDSIKRTVRAIRKIAKAMAKVAKQTAKLLKRLSEAIAKVAAKVITFLVSNPVGWIIDIVILVVLLVVLIIMGVKSSDNSKKGTKETSGIGYSDITTTDEEKFLMYSLAVHEKGAGTEDQMSYVISVVLNRVLTGRYGGSTIKEVIYAENQFQGVSEIEYKDGHYTSGTGTTWQNQCQAVENYLTNGDTGTTSYSNEEVERAINATEKVLSNGDTTATTEYPNGGAVGFASPYYVHGGEAGTLSDWSWFNEEPKSKVMFNDEDGKDKGNTGEHHLSDEKWGSHSFFTNDTDLEILSKYVSSPSIADGEEGWVSTNEVEGQKGTFTINGKTFNLYTQGYYISWSTGCCPTSCAIILSGLGYPEVTPDVVRDEAGGTEASRYIAKSVQSITKRGFSAESDDDQEKIGQYLKEGKQIIAHIDATSSPKKVGSKSHSGYQHFFTILGINNEDKVFIADPGTSYEGDNNGWWPLDETASQIDWYRVVGE